MRWNPGQIRISPLSEIKDCPLARLIRKRLRARRIVVDMTCVYLAEMRGVARDLRAVPVEDMEEHYEQGRRRHPLVVNPITIDNLLSFGFRLERRGAAPQFFATRERKTIGSLPTVTGIVGLTVAHVGLQRLMGMNGRHLHH